MLVLITQRRNKSPLACPPPYFDLPLTPNFIPSISHLPRQRMWRGCVLFVPALRALPRKKKKSFGRKDFDCSSVLASVVSSLASIFIAWCLGWGNYSFRTLIWINFSPNLFFDFRLHSWGEKTYKRKKLQLLCFYIEFIHSQQYRARPLPLLYLCHRFRTIPIISLLSTVKLP